MLRSSTAAFDAWKQAIVQRDKEEKSLSVYQQGSHHISDLQVWPLTCSYIAIKNQIVPNKYYQRATGLNSELTDDGKLWR